MLKGILKVIDDEQMGLLHEGVLEVLEKTGLKIDGDFLLKALAEAGCKVDFEKKRAWFKPDIVEKQIAYQRGRYKMVTSSRWYPFCKEMPENDVAWPDEFSVDYGHNVVWMYDYPSGKYREPTIKDQVEMIKLGNAIEAVKAVSIPLICSEFDERTETIESARLLLLNTNKPGWVEVNTGKQVKYLAELAALAADYDEDIIRTKPPIITHVYCTTSPLKIDARACGVLEENLKYKYPVAFAPMPILGGTTPITPAGSVIIAAAEILGGITATSLIEPDIYYFADVISGEMDMKTTNIRFSTPAAILTDATLHQLFRYKYGIVLNVDVAYIEAKSPGIQNSMLKLFRQMALGCTVSQSLPIGTLDNASAFSPVQAMIDLDMNKAIYEFGKGIEINDETMNLDLIKKLEFCGKENYLSSDQTLKYYRDILWDSSLLDTTYRKKEFYKAQDMDDQVLNRADKMWRDLVASQKDLEVPSKFRREVDRIVDAAKRELLK